MFRCIVSAICGNSRLDKEEVATIEWNDCQPFVPPITCGYVIKKVVLREISTEKYGRILANIYLVTETGEIFINKWMLSNGYAVPYDGKTKQQFDPDSCI